MNTSYELPLADFYQGRILNVAHRGARERAPENTLPAFELALTLGADAIECDVQLSRDGVPVVIHDSTVDRTTDGSGPVAHKTLPELRELDAGQCFPAEFACTYIPLLDEVLETLGHRLLIVIELKEYGPRSALVERVIQAVLAHNLSRRVLLSSFHPFTLRRAKRLAPQIPVGYLYMPGLASVVADGWLARPVIGRHDARHPHVSRVDARYMRWARGHGYRINVWTVNEPADIRRMRDLGVDALITDRPEVVHGLLHPTT